MAVAAGVVLPFTCVHFHEKEKVSSSSGSSQKTLFPLPPSLSFRYTGIQLRRHACSRSSTRSILFFLLEKGTFFSLLFSSCYLFENIFLSLSLSLPRSNSENKMKSKTVIYPFKSCNPLPSCTTVQLVKRLTFPISFTFSLSFHDTYSALLERWRTRRRTLCVCYFLCCSFPCSSIIILEVNLI